jgi:hypothetical protein
MDVHFSELQTLLRCEQKWNLSYRQQLEPIGGPSDALKFGSAFHRLTEAADKGIDVVELGDLEMEAEPLRVLFAVFGAWEKWWRQFRDEHSIKVLEVEHELRLPLGYTKSGERTELVCTVDKLISADGLLWVADVKTSGSPQQSHFPLDQQGLTYTLAARELGLDVQGMLYLQVRTTDPARARTSLFIPTWQPFGLQATQQWGSQLDRLLYQWEIYRELGDEAEYLRRFNPHSWQSCICPFESICQSWLLGREEQAIESLLKPRESREVPIAIDG